MVSKISTFTISGLRPLGVEAETYISRGIPDFEIVGLGDTSVRESKYRIKAAMSSQGLDMPPGRITVNLAPSDIKKAGSCLDLAIALGILSAREDMPKYVFAKTAVIGELSLDGSIRKVNGILAMVAAGKKMGLKAFIVPAENAPEASLVKEVDIIPASSLGEIFMMTRQGFSKYEPPEGSGYIPDEIIENDLSEVAGQIQAKRAIEIAACGGHNILLMGAPGCGKTMMAMRMPGLLPPLTFEEALEITEIYSISGKMPSGVSVMKKRPFRIVHSSVTTGALIGGGRPIMAGEASLAHKGILFMDEMSNAERGVLDSLRQPLEYRNVVLSRVGQNYILPADFIFVGAANPCACGKLFEGNCTCTQKEIRANLFRIPRPIMDRIDLHVAVKKVEYNDIEAQAGESSYDIRKRVTEVRKIQEERYKKEIIKLNGRVERGIALKYFELSKGGERMLKSAFSTLNMSYRAYDKTVKVARTIADMDKSTRIEEIHVAQALQYRDYERGEW